MTVVDLSIGASTSINFTLNGWTDDQRERFKTGVSELPGVTGAKDAGGGSSLLVNFDRKMVSEDDLIDAATKLAHRVVARS